MFNIEKKYKQHNFIFSREQYRYFTNIWDHLLALQTMDKKFDIGIIQLGYHDYVVPWTIQVWKTLECMNENDLKDNLISFPTTKIGSHLFKDCYNFNNDKVIKETFKEIRKYCKKLIFIQMPYSWAEFLERTIQMNKLYSECCDETISLPMDPDFPEKHTRNTMEDRVHYLDEYHEVISNMVIEKIKSLNE